MSKPFSIQYKIEVLEYILPDRIKKEIDKLKCQDQDYPKEHDDNRASIVVSVSNRFKTTLIGFDGTFETPGGNISILTVIKDYEEAKTFVKYLKKNHSNEYLDVFIIRSVTSGFENSDPIPLREIMDKNYIKN